MAVEIDERKNNVRLLKNSTGKTGEVWTNKWVRKIRFWIYSGYF